MEIAASKVALQKLLASTDHSQRVGLVPTMGNLHAGHIKLVNTARRQTDLVICSIFVNPLQFGPNEDLDAYPRTFEADQEKLVKAGCDILFCPTVADMYSSDLGNETVIHVPGISENYCGKSRPGHFDGVATVVCKLFNMTQPTVAFFGLKDFQQFLVIKKLVVDLSLPIKLVGVEIEREASGLAMSSRNNYLDPHQKNLAANLYATLQNTSNKIRSATEPVQIIEQAAIEHLNKLGLQVDYFAICNANNLEPAKTSDKEIVVLAAAFLGKTRLIDNLQVHL